MMTEYELLFLAISESKDHLPVLLHSYMMEMLNAITPSLKRDEPNGCEQSRISSSIPNLEDKIWSH